MFFQETNDQFITIICHSVWTGMELFPENIILISLKLKTYIMYIVGIMYIVITLGVLPNFWS